MLFPRILSLRFNCTRRSLFKYFSCSTCKCDIFRDIGHHSYSSKTGLASNKLINFYATSSKDVLDDVKFDKICEETLESLSEYFEELVDKSTTLKTADVAYSDGVLTVNLGPNYGTYVINRQTPNKQIWLSSPFSGPRRYDFDIDKQLWIYKHGGQILHRILQEEIEKITNIEVDFTSCCYSK